MSIADKACPSDMLSATVATLGHDGKKDIEKVEELIDDYPRDARLHFLRGSLLAGLTRYAEARQAMEAAVELAPDYALARFQLGFLELTSGEAAAAVLTWAPLRSLRPDDPLRRFAGGLEHLIRDEFPTALSMLREGIELNTEIAPLNADMALIIRRVEELLAEKPAGSDDVSATHLLLQQYSGRTKH